MSTKGLKFMAVVVIVETYKNGNRKAFAVNTVRKKRLTLLLIKKLQEFLSKNKFML